MMNHINIAIDGHSSCGKSTIAKNISKKFKMTYVDSGAMYRAVTHYCIQNKFIKDQKINLELLEKSLDKINISFIYNNSLDKVETILNKENVENIIRSHEVSENVSKISQLKIVREKLIHLQQVMIKNKNVVMDGRDIGTKVMPNAELKLFITADIDIRAQRRFNEIKNKDNDLTYKKVFDNLNKRDFDDVNREINPLIKAQDSIEIDNSNLSEIEQNNLVFELILDKIKL